MSVPDAAFRVVEALSGRGRVPPPRKTARGEPTLGSQATASLGEDKVGFYGGRHALKTYVCVRKSSSNAMGRLVGAENVIQTT